MQTQAAGGASSTSRSTDSLSANSTRAASSALPRNSLPEFYAIENEDFDVTFSRSSGTIISTIKHTSDQKNQLIFTPISNLINYRKTKMDVSPDYQHRVPDVELGEAEDCFDPPMIRDPNRQVGIDDDDFDDDFFGEGPEDRLSHVDIHSLDIIPAEIAGQQERVILLVTEAVSNPRAGYYDKRFFSHTYLYSINFTDVVIRKRIKSSGHYSHKESTPWDDGVIVSSAVTPIRVNGKAFIFILCCLGLACDVVHEILEDDSCEWESLRPGPHGYSWQPCYKLLNYGDDPIFETYIIDVDTLQIVTRFHPCQLFGLNSDQAFKRRFRMMEYESFTLNCQFSSRPYGANNDIILLATAAPDGSGYDNTNIFISTFNCTTNFFSRPVAQIEGSCPNFLADGRLLFAANSDRDWNDDDGRMKQIRFWSYDPAFHRPAPPHQQQQQQQHQRQRQQQQQQPQIFRVRLRSDYLFNLHDKFDEISLLGDEKYIMLRDVEPSEREIEEYYNHRVENWERQAKGHRVHPLTATYRPLRQQKEDDDDDDEDDYDDYYEEPPPPEPIATINHRRSFRALVRNSFFLYEHYFTNTTQFLFSSPLALSSPNPGSWTSVFHSVENPSLNSDDYDEKRWISEAVESANSGRLGGIKVAVSSHDSSIIAVTNSVASRDWEEDVQKQPNIQLFKVSDADPSTRTCHTLKSKRDIENAEGLRFVRRNIVALEMGRDVESGVMRRKFFSLDARVVNTPLHNSVPSKKSLFRRGVGSEMKRDRSEL